MWGPLEFIKADAFVGLFNSPGTLREQLIFSVHFTTKQNENRSSRVLHGYTVIKGCVRTRPERYRNKRTKAVFLCPNGLNWKCPAQTQVLHTWSLVCGAILKAAKPRGGRAHKGVSLTVTHDPGVYSPSLLPVSHLVSHPLTMGGASQVCLPHQEGSKPLKR